MENKTNTSTIQQSWLYYFDDGWNVLDAMGCFLFLIGVFLRLISIAILSYDVFIWSRYLKAIKKIVELAYFINKMLFF